LVAGEVGTRGGAEAIGRARAIGVGRAAVGRTQPVGRAGGGTGIVRQLVVRLDVGADPRAMGIDAHRAVVALPARRRAERGDADDVFGAGDRQEARAARIAVA